MTPILYAANETQFNSMGIGALADAISAHATEERNGAFELEFGYPVDGPLFNELQKDRIVKVKANDDANMDLQLFRIYYISKPINGQCQYKAEHVSYELGKNPITSVNVTGTAQQFMNAVLANTLFPHRFTAISDDPATSSSSLIRVSAREAFGGTTGSLIQIWGGELTFDNWLIRHSLNRGTDTGIIVGYGKNLTDLNQEEAIDTTYTSIYPYATIQVPTGEGEDASTTDQVIELPEKYVNSQYVGNYAYDRCLPVDLSGDDVTDEASLRAKAQQYITSNDIGKPTVNLTVSFINLWQTEEYTSIAPLEHINLCDYVTVRFKKLGVDVKAKVIKTDYDVLAERYLSVELGDPKSNLADDINGMQTTIADVSATANQAAKISGYALTQANGKNRNFYSETFPTEGMIKNDILFMKVNGQYLKKYHYDGIQWVLDVSADANDALEAANQAMESANGKTKVFRQAAEPTGELQDNYIWFRDNPDGTITQFTYKNGEWSDPQLAGVKAAQDQANTAVATADAASAQASNALNTANSASGQAATAINTANAANSAAITAQQTAGDAAAQASNAWNNAQTAIGNAQSALDAYNNMQIGGLNLLPNSAFIKDDGWSATGNHSATIDSEIYQTRKCLHLVSSGVGGGYPGHVEVNYSGGNYADNDSFVLSFYAKSLSGNVSFHAELWGSRGAENFVLTGEWQKFTVHLMFNAASTMQILYFWLNGAGECLINSPKLSTGDKITDWSSAPEDVQVQIDNINGTLTQKVSQDQFDTLAGTVSSQATAITQNQQDIGLKANKDYVDAINQTVQSHSTAISENAQTIELKADSSTVNTLTGRVSTAEATLTTQANQIAARITSQDADAKYATQTALTATSTSLTSSISAVQTNLNNLQIGVRNLLLNSGFSENTSTWAGSHGSSISLGTSSDSPYTSRPDLNHGILKIVQLLGQQYAYMSQNLSVTAGRKYVISGYVYAGSSVPSGVLRVGIYETSGGSWTLGRITTIETRDSWTYFTYTFTPSVSSIIFVTGVGGTSTSISNTIYLELPKLEVGDKATSWQPAPEDLATSVQFSQLNQTVANISTTVSQKVDQSTYNTYVSQTATTLSAKLNSSTAASTYATQTSLTATSSSLQTNINAKVDTTTYNSKISQLSSDINLRVSKNDVVNQINVSTESILIAGNKVHITGQTTIDSAVITNAMIASIDIGKATTGTLDANRIGAKSVTVDKLDVANLAAISANLGSVTSGVANSITVNASTINGTNIYGSWFQVNNVPNNGGGYDTVTLGDKTADMNAAIYVQRQSTVNPSTTAIDSYGMTWYKYGLGQTGHDVSPYAFYKDYVEIRSYAAEDGNIEVKTAINARRISMWYGDMAEENRRITIDAKASEIDAGVMKANFFESWNDIDAHYSMSANQFLFINDGGRDTGLSWITDGEFSLISNTQERIAIKQGDVIINPHLTVNGNAAANEWNINSLLELKTDINAYSGSALSVINSTDIYFYKYKSDTETEHVGPIIGDGYNLPDIFLSSDKKGTDDHSAIFTTMQAVKELSVMHQQDILKIAELETRISELEKGAAA
jgi:phage minor structural protein